MLEEFQQNLEVSTNSYQMYSIKDITKIQYKFFQSITYLSTNMAPNTKRLIIIGNQGVNTINTFYIAILHIFLRIQRFQSTKHHPADHLIWHFSEDFLGQGFSIPKAISHHVFSHFYKLNNVS